MRSHQQYIITKDEVHGYANYWLKKSLRLEYEGTKCTASTLLQVMLIAASRMVSIFAACREQSADERYLSSWNVTYFDVAPSPSLDEPSLVGSPATRASHNGHLRIFFHMASDPQRPSLASTDLTLTSCYA